MKKYIFIKLLPVISYISLMIWHQILCGAEFENVIVGGFTSILLIPINYWSIAFLEIFLYAPSSKAKKTFGIITIITSTLNIPWLLKVNDFAFSFAGHWTLPLRILVWLNIVYILVVIGVSVWARRHLVQSDQNKPL